MGDTHIHRAGLARMPRLVALAISAAFCVRLRTSRGKNDGIWNVEFYVMQPHPFSRLLTLVATLGVLLTTMVLAAPTGAAQDDAGDCAGVRSGAVCVEYGAPPTDGGACPISDRVLYEDGECFYLIQSGRWSTTCIAPFTEEVAQNGLIRSRDCMLVNTTADPAFTCPAPPADHVVQIELVSSDPFVIAQCVLFDTSCRSGTTPADEPGFCRQPVEVRPGLGCQAGYFVANGACVRERLLSTIDATCSSGRLILLSCRENELRPARVQASCQTSDIVLQRDGECYVLVGRDGDDCPDGTTEDDATDQCRQPVAHRPGPTQCSPGFEIRNSFCSRWHEADGLPDYQCPEGDTDAPECQNRLLINYGLGAPSEVGERVRVSYYGCLGRPTTFGSPVASLEVRDATTDRLLGFINMIAIVDRGKYLGSYFAPTTPLQKLELRVACADGSIERANTVLDFSSPLCNGVPATINMNTGAMGIGTPGDDVILGTNGPDLITGGGGNDIICGLRGNDTIRGGFGDDTIFGDDGNDTIFSGQGVNEAHGGDGDDVIQGGAAIDRLEGGFGDDTLRGGGGNDVLVGDFGNDVLHGNSGDDELRGGPGDDRAFGYAGDDIISGGEGMDRLHGNFGADSIDGGADDDRIWGYGDDDRLRGGIGNDLISGNFGDDLIEGNGGDDELWGSDGADRLRGNAGFDLLYGNSGEDDLDGGPDADLCDGGIGTDTAAACEAPVRIP